MKRTISLLAALSLISALLLTSVYGHEVFIDSNNQGIVLRFNDTNVTEAPAIRVHYAQLDDFGVPAMYYSNAPAAIESWNYAGYYGIYVTNEYQSQLTTDGANIIIMCNSDAWEEYVEYPDLTLACTVLEDTNGLELLTSEDAGNSTGIIAFASIYMNPSIIAFTYRTSDPAVVSNRVKKTIVHEIGHAIGLGHPDRQVYWPISETTYSVMRQGYPDEVLSGTVPQTHDKLDICSMY